MRRNYTNQELAEMLKDDTFFISTLVNTIDGLAGHGGKKQAALEAVEEMYIKEI